MEKQNHFGLVLLGLLLAVGIALAGYFVGQTLYNAKVAINTAEAKGLAERRVSADRAHWKLIYRITGATRESVPELYQQAEQNQAAIVAILKEGGFSEEEIQLGVIDYIHREYRDENQKLVDQKHQLVGSISVETEQVALVAKVRAKVNKLIAKGIDIENHPPSYRFTRLNEIKPDMLKEATQNARIAANEFADNAGVKVGGIRTARQGNFFIRDAGENYGDDKKIEKDVRVVTTITFYLTEA